MKARQTQAADTGAFERLLRLHGPQIFPLEDQWVTHMTAHYELLVRWNQQLNLTRVIEPEAAVLRHYCESLLVAKHLPTAERVADLGSGAGFPGVPLAVSRPSIQVTLIESHQRKAAFLREVTRGLGNVRVLASRAEEVTERFDCVVSRAVRWQDVLAAHLAPNVALLVGKSDASQLVSTDGFTWNVIEGWPLEGESRLVVGVSRGT